LISVVPQLLTISLAWLENSITPLGLRRLLREQDVPDAFWYELKRLRRPPPSRTGEDNVVEMLRKAVQEFQPFGSESLPPGGLQPVEEYYSDTSSGFSVIPELSQPPEDNLGSESLFVLPS
jgi:hypothetical protein